MLRKSGIGVFFLNNIVNYIYFLLKSLSDEAKPLFFSANPPPGRTPLLLWVVPGASGTALKIPPKPLALRVKDFGGFEEGQGSFRRPVLFTVTELIVLFIAAIEGGHAGKTTWGVSRLMGRPRFTVKRLASSCSISFCLSLSFRALIEPLPGTGVFRLLRLLTAAR